MHGIVIRLAGVSNPATRVVHQEAISIGTAADCDLQIISEDHFLPPETFLLTLRLTDGVYRVAALASEANLLRDGEPIAVGEAIHDGDTFHFGSTGIRLRFFALSDAAELSNSLRLGTAVLARVRPAHKPVRIKRGDNGALEEVAVPRTDVALVFVKQLLRELAAEIPRRWLYVMAGVAALLLITAIYIPTLSFIQGQRNQKAITDLNQTITGTQRKLEEITSELTKVRANAESAISSVSFASRVVESYGQSVCLIYGMYTFVDPRAGREARFREASENSNPINPNGGLNLSIDGSGRVYETEFIGTGFLVDKGLVLTNRHVLQPWEDDPVASLIRAQGLRPRVRELLVYIPKIHQPLVLKQLPISAEHDVALCGFEQGDMNLPIMPLDEKDEGAVSGQSVVLIGYPAGLDGLLARVDEGERLGLQRMTLRIALNELAAREQIRPQSTQGHIGDITPRQLVYDAPTSSGGSGGPVFGLNGKVIGINQAVLPNTPSNFGVPIRYGIELIQKYKTQANANLPTQKPVASLQTGQ
jgi:S1-C subfamily serine protease